MNNKKSKREIGLAIILNELDCQYISGSIGYDEYLSDIYKDDYLLSHGIYNKNMEKDTRCDNRENCLEYCDNYNKCKQGSCCDGYICRNNSW